MPASHGLLEKGGRITFRVTLVEDGTEVDNPGYQPFLPWAVFEETLQFLIRKGGRAPRDNYVDALGSPGLALDSVEAHVAQVVYGSPLGRAVFRRITPITCILIWAGVCERALGELVLRGPVHYTPRVGSPD